MVYHEPNAQPWYNDADLGVLRVLVSDQEAARVIRLCWVGGAKYALIGCGVGWALERLLASGGAGGGGSTAAATAKTPRNNRLVAVGLAAVFGYNAVRLVRYLHDKWATHMCKQPGVELPKKFFWMSDAEGEAPQGASGVLFNRKTKRWHTHPIRSHEEGHARAFNYDGLTFRDFVFAELTIGWELPVKASMHAIAHYAGSKRWNTPAAYDADLRKTLYRGVINTGLAVFVVDNVSNPLHGHVVLEKVMLPFAQQSTRIFDRIVVFLDHVSWEVVKMTMEWTAFSGGHECETWGSRDERENARPDLKLTVEESLFEVGKVCLAVIALHTHSSTHMWANGTHGVAPEQWALQPQSHNVTQWMNSQAVYGSWRFVGCPEVMMGQILAHNNALGLPLHSHGELTRLIGERSEFHQMAVNARWRLAEHFEANAGARAAMPELDALLAATLFHSAEHYYGGALFPKEANCVPLRTDLSGLVLFLVSPLSYHTQALLVSQNLHDPVCQILYDAARKVNTDFAENALSIGCAY